MKNTIAPLLLVLPLALAGCHKSGPTAAQLEANRLALWQVNSNSAVQEHRESLARKEMLPVLTNEVVGLRTILQIGINADTENPSNWTAFATVEYVNHLGGVDRTNLAFRFAAERLYPNSRDQLLATQTAIRCFAR